MRKLIIVASLVVLAAGCQAGKTRQSAGGKFSDTPADKVSQAPKKKSAFSLGSIWRAVSFQGEEGSETDPLVPQEVVQLGEVVQTIAGRAGELTSEDPPEVTRKKALGILDSLKPWESLMAAGQSVGLIGGKTAGVLNSLVAKLKEKTQELVEYAPKPETIRAVKYLAGQLGLAYTNTVGLLSRSPQAPSGP